MIICLSLYMLICRYINHQTPKKRQAILGESHDTPTPTRTHIHPHTLSCPLFLSFSLLLCPTFPLFYYLLHDTGKQLQINRCMISIGHMPRSSKCRHRSIVDYTYKPAWYFIHACPFHNHVVNLLVIFYTYLLHPVSFSHVAKWIEETGVSWLWFCWSCLWYGCKYNDNHQANRQGDQPRGNLYIVTPESIYIATLESIYYANWIYLVIFFHLFTYVAWIIIWPDHNMHT